MGKIYISKIKPSFLLPLMKILISPVADVIIENKNKSFTRYKRWLLKMLDRNLLLKKNGISLYP